MAMPFAVGEGVIALVSTFYSQIHTRWYNVYAFKTRWQFCGLFFKAPSAMRRRPFKVHIQYVVER